MSNPIVDSLQMRCIHSSDVPLTSPHLPFHIPTSILRNLAKCPLGHLSKFGTLRHGAGHNSGPRGRQKERFCMDISTCRRAAPCACKKRDCAGAALLRIRAAPFCSQVLADTHTPPPSTPLPFFPSFFSFFPSFFSFFPFPSSPSLLLPFLSLSPTSCEHPPIHTWTTLFTPRPQV